MGRIIHVGDGPDSYARIDITDAAADTLIANGYLYECGDGHDLHVSPDSGVTVHLETLILGMARAASAESSSLDGDLGFRTIDVEDKVYRVGDTTMRRVFEPAGLRNMSDMQAVMDAVEKALNEQPAPAAGEVKGLPVAGYKPTQSQEAIDLVNEGKVLEERVLRWIERVDEKGPRGSAAYRFLVEANTMIQGGFMFAYRSVFQPNGSRIRLPEDEA